MFNKKLSFLFCSLKCLQDNLGESVCPIKGRKWCFWRLISGLWLAALGRCQFHRRPGVATLLPASLGETMGLIVLHLFSCCYRVKAEMELTGCSVTCFAVGQRIGFFFFPYCDGEDRCLWKRGPNSVLTEGVGMAACSHHHM